ncbi:MAG: rhodanese-like domain-containing protein [Motiliproteus sp.]
MKGLSIIFSFTLLLISFNLAAGEREAQAWEYIKQGAVVIDVRTTEEYAQGHLQDSLHIPYQRIANQLQNLELRKDRQIVLYCRSGQRAGIAEATLVKAGYGKLFNGGGFGPLVQQLRASQTQ